MLHNSGVNNLDTIIYTDNQGKFVNLEPGFTLDTENPLILTMRNSEVMRNYAGIYGLIRGAQNSKAYVYDTIFDENFSLGRGSVIFGDYK